MAYGSPMLFTAYVMTLFLLLGIAGKRPKPVQLLLAALFLYMSLYSIRYIPLFAVIAAYYIHYGFNHKDVWEIAKGKNYYIVCKKIGETVPADSLVGSLELSGSIKLYSGIESFNSLHHGSILFIKRMLREKVPIYVLFEPWHKENQRHQRLFRLFKMSKIMDFPIIPGLQLYRIKSRRIRPGLSDSRAGPPCRPMAGGPG